MSRSRSASGSRPARSSRSAARRDRRRRPGADRRGDHDRGAHPVARATRRDPPRRGHRRGRARPAARRPTGARWSFAASRSRSALHLLEGEPRSVAPGPSAAARRGPLVGRRPKRAGCATLLDRHAPRPVAVRRVLVVGEAGIGKTRLFADLEADARDRGVAWTWTESTSYGQAEPYRFARVFAQAVADEHDVDSGTFARSLLFTPDLDAAEIAALRRRDRRDRPRRRLLGLGGGDPGHAVGPGRGRRRRCSRSRGRYVDRLLATAGPRVVVLDDVHWLDRSSDGMVEVLLERAGRLPLVVLASMRPGPSPTGCRPGTWSASTSAGLSTARDGPPRDPGGRAALDSDDARRIHERTDGNPLFIAETVRASLEDGTPRLPRRPRVPDRRLPDGLPVTLRAVLGARIDALPRDARDALGVAVGRRDPVPVGADRTVARGGALGADGRAAGRRGADRPRRRRRAGGSATRSSTTRRTWASSQRTAARSMRASPTELEGGGGPAPPEPDRRSTARPRATRRGPSRCWSLPRTRRSGSAPRPRRPPSGGRRRNCRPTRPSPRTIARGRRRARPARRGRGVDRVPDPPSPQRADRDVRPATAGRIHDPVAAHMAAISSRRAGGSGRGARRARRRRSPSRSPPPAVRWPRSSSSCVADRSAASISSRSAPRIASTTVSLGPVSPV